MNWDALGALANALGAVGVIISVVYLSVQIRRNTAATKAATLQGISDAAQLRLVAVAQSPDLAEALHIALTPDAKLSPAQELQIRFFLRAAYRGFENLYVQYRHGLISKEEWQGYEWTLKAPRIAGQLQRQWWLQERQSFSPEFARHVDGIGQPDRA